MKTTRSKPRKISHPGIVRHAAKLGVTYSYLFKVATGRVKSPDLLQRYEALVEQDRKAAALEPERELVSETLKRAEEIVLSVNSESSEEEKEAALAAREQLVTPELKEAISKVGTLPIATTLRFTALFSPSQTDRIFGIKRDAKNPRRIIIGGAA